MGIRWARQLTKAVSTHAMSGLVRRGLDNPATNPMARRLWAGLRDAWYKMGEQADADSSSWRTFVQKERLIKEAPSQGWRGAITRLKEWSISNAADLSEIISGFMDEVLQNEENRQLPLKLRLAATAKSSLASDMKRRVVATVEINPRDALEIPDVRAGGSVDETRMGRASRDAACAAGIELNEILNGGPRRKMAKVKGKLSERRRREAGPLPCAAAI